VLSLFLQRLCHVFPQQFCLGEPEVLELYADVLREVRDLHVDRRGIAADNDIAVRKDKRDAKQGAGLKRCVLALRLEKQAVFAHVNDEAEFGVFEFSEGGIHFHGDVIEADTGIASAFDSLHICKINNGDSQ
jgi:hypothetical protein